MDFQATIVSVLPKTYTKANGKSYILAKCLCTSGKLDGIEVLAQRTLGADKKSIDEGMQVTLHHTEINGAHFFEISTSQPFSQAASNELLSQLLGTPSVSAEPVAPLVEQAV